MKADFELCQNGLIHFSKVKNLKLRRYSTSTSQICRRKVFLSSKTSSAFFGAVGEKSYEPCKLKKKYIFFAENLNLYKVRKLLH